MPLPELGHPFASVETPPQSAVMVLVEARYRAQHQPAGLLQALVGDDVAVTVVDPDEMVHELDPRPDIADASVVVARGRSQTLLTALDVAERFGVETVNRSIAVTAVRDKAAMAAALVTAGLPTPRTWVGPPAALAGSIPSASYPIVLKPVFGDNGRGIRLITTPGDLASPCWPESTALAQEFVPDDGGDLKVYAVGERMWAVRAPSPLAPPAAGRGEPSPDALTVELAEIARACGSLFGLELFGVDCVVTPNGPVVIEVNDFPNYHGVAEADEALAAHVRGKVKRRP